MYEFASLRIDLGNWQDSAEGKAPIPAIDIDFGDQEFPDAHDVATALRESGLDPWQTTETVRHYYANASSVVFQVVIDAYPTVALAISSGMIGAVAEKIISRLLDLFTRQPEWDVGAAHEIAQRMLLYHVRLSDADLSQLSAVQRDDGAWVFVFHDARAGEDHLVAVAKNGVAGHVNLGALRAGKERADEQQRQWAAESKR